MESTPKRRKSSSSTLPDRISELPDIVIGEILSLLSTKQAVATSILSKRWRFLWTSIRNLHFDCSEMGEDIPFYLLKMDELQREAAHSDYVEFVDRVLRKRTSRKVHKFYLRADYRCESDVSRWICEAINCNVEVLDLRVPEAPGYIFICQSLISLKLHIFLNKILHCPNSFHLPKFKVLDIGWALLTFVQELISCCPALEDLALNVQLNSQSSFVISRPLKRLKILTMCDDGLDEDCKLVIELAQLEFLDIRSEDSVPTYVIKDLGSVVEAKLRIGNVQIDVEEHETSMNVEVLSKLTGVESLTLDVISMDVLEYDEQNMLPIFNKMTRLELETTICYGSSKISAFLEACPSLKILILKMVNSYHMHATEFHWIKPQSVPPCLSSCLEVIEVFQLKGMAKRGFKMMKYLLGNGEVLNKFIIKTSFSTMKEKFNFYNTLLKFSRASRFCEVIFSPDCSEKS